MAERKQDTSRVELFPTLRRNQCRERQNGKICNKAGFSEFRGVNGIFPRCRHHTMMLAKRRDDVYLDGVELDLPGEFVPHNTVWEMFL